MSTDAPTEAPEATEAPEVETTETAATDLNAEVEKWKALARKNEARAKENADKARRLDEVEKANMSELEKAQARLAELEQESSANALKALRATIAAEAGVPATLLNGADEDSLRESAQALIAFKGTSPKAPTPDGQGKVGTPIGSVAQLTDADLSRMTPEQINQARREGRLDNLLGKS